MAGVITSALTRQAACTVSVERTGTDELLRRFVLATGARASANAQRPLGVCPVPSKVAKEIVPVDVEGIVPIVAGAAIALDATTGMKALMSDAAGRAVTRTGVNPIRAYALSAASAADEVVSARLVDA